MRVAEAHGGGQGKGVLDQLHRNHLRLRRPLSEGGRTRAGQGEAGQKGAAGQDHDDGFRWNMEDDGEQIGKSPMPVDHGDDKARLGFVTLS
jgi:hypothetical protein